MSDNFNVMNRIEELMTFYDISQYRLCKIADIPQSTFASWKSKGTLPPVDKIEKICNALGITLMDFFNTSDNSTRISESDERHLKKWKLLSKKQQNDLDKVIEDILLSRK